MSAERAWGLALGFLVDRVVGDPQRWHPVAGFGRVASAAEHAWWADSRSRGAWHLTALAGGAVALGVAVGVAAERTGSAPLRTVTTAVATWAVLGGRSLDREAAAIQSRLDGGDLTGARRRLARIVGRDTTQLGPTEVARAVVESLAENTSDAVVAPLVWGSVAGVPGLLGYRAVNTLDAMVGHRTPRLERFGWASARCDDLVNLPGARLSGLLTILAAPAVRGSAAQATSAVRRDAGRHPSPNAGVVEAAFAGALGVRLGGSNRYSSGIEHRAVLGAGRDCRPDDLGRARRLARLVQWGAAAASVGATVAAARVRCSEAGGGPTGRGTLRR